MKAGVSINKINYVAYSGAGVQHGRPGRKRKGVVNSIDELLALHEGKKLRLLAISSAKRSTYPGLKDVPTLRRRG